jgi:hypothetical protein
LTLIAYFQDLSKVDTLVLVRVLDLTKTRTTLDKKNNFMDSVTRLVDDFLGVGVVV